MGLVLISFLLETRPWDVVQKGQSWCSLKCFVKSLTAKVIWAVSGALNLFIYLFFLFNLLVWHWLIKLHRFQMYNSLIHHLYILLRVHHSKPGFLLLPFIPPLPSSTSPYFFPLGNHHAVVVCVHEFFSQTKVVHVCRILCLKWFYFNVNNVCSTCRHKRYDITE